MTSPPNSSFVAYSLRGSIGRTFFCNLQFHVLTGFDLPFRGVMDLYLTQGAIGLDPTTVPDK